MSPDKILGEERSGVEGQVELRGAVSGGRCKTGENKQATARTLM